MSREGEKVPYDRVILRFSGEIGVKSRPVRLRLERRVEEVVKEELARQGIRVVGISRFPGRLIIGTPEARTVAARLSKVFGISSLSPALRTTSDLRDIVEASLRIAKSTLKPYSTFAVKCRRVGKHPYRSMEVCRIVGEAILKGEGLKDLKVDLDEPDVTIGIEVRDAEAYVFVEEVCGPGGFPVGSQGRALCLLSGGIDSAVAFWLATKRGCLVVPVYFDNEPFTDEATRQKAFDVARKLSEWTQGRLRYLYVVPHGQNLKEFLDRCPMRLTCLLCKRMMYRVAEGLTELEGAEGFFTGEAIGEQASQTMRNLRILDQAAVRYPVHRPLLGFDKEETERIARRIGVYELTTIKTKGCLAAPEKPATRARLEDVLEAEKRLDLEAMVHRTIEGARTRSL